MWLFFFDHRTLFSWSVSWIWSNMECTGKYCTNVYYGEQAAGQVLSMGREIQIRDRKIMTR